MKNNNEILFYALILGIIIGFVAVLFATPVGVKIINDYNSDMRKTDDESNYKTLKNVEDTCRSMIASYESDKMTYEQYKDSDSEEKQSWAEQAKMRANKTASSYNNYILKNSHVWKNDVPEDIKDKLEFIK